ncbi:hypothetical protein HZS_1528 [Henneguya salminicola]|nr:hypothetical protein HZS_1528 [Henneguya salminicola]
MPRITNGLNVKKNSKLSSTQGVTSPPPCYKENGQPFFRRPRTGDIHNEYHMTFDLGTQTFVPSTYALMTGKFENLYSVILDERIFVSEF